MRTTLAVGATAALALAASAQAIHTPYDIAGWVETVDARASGFADFPTHRVYAHGGGFRLGFNASDTKAVPFKVCLTQKEKALKCWTSTAWPVKRITVTTFFAEGKYVVKWYVEGRIRATWRLLIYGEDG